MKDLIAQLKNYLAEVAEPNIFIEPDLTAKRKIPVFIGQSYGVFRARLFGRRYTLLVFKDATPPTPSQAAKHVDRIHALLGSAVVFVFPKLQAFERKRYIQQRIPFIVPRRQIYLPMVLIDLRESPAGRTGAKGDAPRAFSASAQVLLLYYFQKPIPEPWPLQRWAQVLGYSKMTLTRARNELVNAELCLPEEKGRTIQLCFPQDRHALWKKALPYLRSPVQKQHYIQTTQDKNLRLYEAGITALSQRTLISADPNPVYALSSADYRKAIKEQRVEEQPFVDEDTLVIECWRYAPALLSPDGRTVDTLSLYLSLQSDPNERIQDALQALMETISW